MANKSVTTNVYVEFDMDDFDTSEIIDELQIRKNKSDITTKELQSIADIVGFKTGQDDSIKIQSLSDKIKFEHICKIFNKYSSQQIESALPE